MASRGSGIVINLIANTREFITGTKRAGDSLDDFGDDLQQVARDGDKAGEKLEQSFREVAHTVNKTGSSAKRDLREVGEEGGQTARETAASFDGSFESIIGGFQEVAAQAFGSLGKIGAASGLAAAGAIGLIVAAYGKAQEAQEKLNEQANNYFQSLVDAGGQLDVNAQKALEQQAIAELGGGNLFLGQKKLNELAADGVATRETMIRLLTGQLLPGDYAQLDAARQITEESKLLNTVVGGSAAVSARKDRLADAQALLDLQKQGTAAVQAQAVFAETYARTIRELIRLGDVAPGIGRAEVADQRNRP